MALSWISLALRLRVRTHPCDMLQTTTHWNGQRSKTRRKGGSLPDILGHTSRKPGGGRLSPGYHWQLNKLRLRVRTHPCDVANNHALERATVKNQEEGGLLLDSVGHTSRKPGGWLSPGYH